MLAARAHDLAILDGTFNDLDDRKGLRAECLQGRDMGMDGKTVIHPTQVPIANEVFAPDAEEVAWARQVVEAFARPDNVGVEVMRLAGRMVERLHERAARRTLALAEAIEKMEKAARDKAAVPPPRRLSPVEAGRESDRQLDPGPLDARPPSRRRRCRRPSPASARSRRARSAGSAS